MIPRFLFVLLFLPHFSFAQEKNVISVSDAFYIPRSTTAFYKLGNKNIPILFQQYGNSQDIVCINLHDDEKTSVSAARKFLEKNGGLLVKIQNNDERLIRFRYRNHAYTIDPNRIFSNEGILNNLEKLRNRSTEALEEVEKFGAYILSLVPDSSKIILALHNNTNGGYSAKSYLQGASMENDAKEVYINPLLDPDDFVFTTDSTVYYKMKEWKFNSILQHNENAVKDGSLSVYYGEMNRRYINIETQAGNENEYRRMIEKIPFILNPSTQQ